MRWLITGSAGFVGFHVARNLLSRGEIVTGLDGLTPYYDVQLKKQRHAVLSEFANFTPHHHRLEDQSKIEEIGLNFKPEYVIHFAGQAGVRHSLQDPASFVSSNIVGTFHLLELCRKVRPKHLLIASTSSVYGQRQDFPLAETDRADYPLTPYAASKKSIEAMAHSYAHSWELPTTIVRLFTVYGPWGRPDMALFTFVHRILRGEPIDIYNGGKLARDFTYVEDVAQALLTLAENMPVRGSPVLREGDSLSPVAPYRVVNVGGDQPVSLLDFISEIEAHVGRKAIRNYLPMQPGDVFKTAASTRLIEALIGFRPSTPLAVGIREFVRWYRGYYNL